MRPWSNWTRRGRRLAPLPEQSKSIGSIRDFILWKGRQPATPTILIVLSLLCFVTAAHAGTYTTTFPLTENPISEGGNWIGGLEGGLDWSDMQTGGGVASGMVRSNNGGQYNDPTALLNGTWGPNQTVTATVYVSGSNPGSEVELRLHSSMSSHVSNGYEVDAAATGTGSNFLVLVRWNGALGNFTFLGTTCNYPAVCGQVRGINVNNGDVLKATINSSGVINAYINGTLIATATDTTFPGGNPGMGTDGPIGTEPNWGFSSFTATDGNSGNPPAITSPLTSYGTVGASYSYQITASNSPTSFNATGLPAGLSVNINTGVISGTPATAGTSTVTLSATHAAGIGSATLALTIYSACDLNHDKSTNVADVQLEVNAALGVTACTPANDINKDGVCNVVDVQRVVVAALGGACVSP